MEKALKKYSVHFILFFLFCLSFSTSADFSQDLGRHLKLGEIIWQTRAIPNINLFSYTNASFSFVNHHWMAEVLFYTSNRIFGLSSLQIMKIVLVVSAGWISMKSGLAKGGRLVVCTISLFLFPLLLDRLDIRPELFGYVFFAIILYILFFQENRKLYYFVPLILLLWANTHITFIFGVGLIFLKRRKFLAFFSLFAVMLNPHGIWGALYPLNIWKNYGYTIVENQNLFFLKSVMVNPIIQYFLLSVPVILIALFILLARKKYAFFIILLTFFVLPFWQVRHMPFFVFAAIPTVSHAFSQVLSTGIYTRYGGSRNMMYAIVVLSCVLLSFAFISNFYYLVFDKGKSFGMSYNESQKQATDFVMKSKLKGNIFNNFDIGGYFIYRLFPKYKVFVDNRPEAYPAEFFQDVYIPLQEKKELRETIFRRYNIHTIFFSHTDMTPWGRAFMQQILKEPQWRMIYLDDSIVILTDEEKYSDIRSENEKIARLVSAQDDYLSLLRLSSILSVMGKDNHSRQAFIKAQKLNPSSCSIKRATFGVEELNNSWVCTSLFSF
jgi:hypothetical protein